MACRPGCALKAAAVPNMETQVGNGRHLQPPKRTWPTSIMRDLVALVSGRRCCMRTGRRRFGESLAKLEGRDLQQIWASGACNDARWSGHTASARRTLERLSCRVTPRAAASVGNIRREGMCACAHWLAIVVWMAEFLAGMCQR